MDYKELGKWLMDVGKYVTTAVIVSSFLSSFEETWKLYIIGIAIAILTVGLGFMLVNKNNLKK